MKYNLTSDPRRSRRGTVEARKRRRWRMQPTLMALEDRRLLSTIVVNNPTDTPVKGQIDLRQAIVAANTAGGPETIVFDSTVFKTPQTITLNPALGQLELSDTTGTEAIVGPKAGVTVSGGGSTRVFQVDSGVTASISGLTITGGNTASNGAGLYNSGTTTLTDCTISGNTAIGGSVTNEGGGIFNSGTLTLTNSTISGNKAFYGPGPQYSSYGGGIFNSGLLTVTSSTISGNSAAYLGGGGIDNSGGTATLNDTIVAGNTYVFFGNSDVVGPVSGSYNLIGTGGSGGLVDGADGNLVGVANPGLGTLGNYGGPTQTMALLPGSPAIDAGNNSLIPSGVTTDQRGLPRIVNGTVDIGAFESSGFTIAVTSGSGQSASGARSRPAGRDRHGEQPDRAGGGGFGDLHPAGQRSVGDDLGKPGGHRRRRHGERHGRVELHRRHLHRLGHGQRSTGRGLV